MTLQPTFALTPRAMLWTPIPSSDDYYVLLDIYGVRLPPLDAASDSRTFDNQYAADCVYFDRWIASDASLNYRSYSNRRMAPRVELHSYFPFHANKQLALVFGFSAISPARVLLWSFAAQLGDVSLVPGDNQFMMEIENLEFPLHLYLSMSAETGCSRVLQDT